MKQYCIFIVFLLFVVLSKVKAEEFVYIYTDWFDYFPSDVESFRIQSEDRYKWYRINDNGDYEETDEYYSTLDGYERIDDSIKTYYRVINNEFVIFDNEGNLIKDTNQCLKVFCAQVYLKKYEPHEEVPTVPEVDHEEPIINPDTYDGIYNYIGLFIISSSLLTFLIIKNKPRYA